MHVIGGGVHHARLPVHALVLLLDLTRRPLIVTVILGHSGHIKGAEASHYSLPVLLVIPHLRVLLSELAIADDRAVAVLRHAAHRARFRTLLLVGEKVRFSLQLAQHRVVSDCLLLGAALHGGGHPTPVGRLVVQLQFLH